MSVNLTVALLDVFQKAVDLELDRVQKDYCLENWPSEAPRWLSRPVVIHFEPSRQQYDLRAGADFYGSERADVDGFARRLIGSCVAELTAPDLDVDSEIQKILFVAVSKILAIRIKNQMRRWSDNEAGLED